MGIFSTFASKIKSSLESIKAGGVENPNKLDPALAANLQKRGMVDISGKTISEPEKVKKIIVQQKATANQAAIEQQKKTQPIKVFSATHYDPMDARQTKANPNGIGAFNKKVEFGDVAMGNRQYAQGTKIYIPELKDVKTPYGNGVFRVNDVKNDRYNNGKDSFDIALGKDVPGAEALKKRIGNNQMHFQIIDTTKTAPIDQVTGLEKATKENPNVLKPFAFQQTAELLKATKGEPVTTSITEPVKLSPFATANKTIAKQLSYGEAPINFMEKTPLEKAKTVAEKIPNIPMEAAKAVGTLGKYVAQAVPRAIISVGGGAAEGVLSLVKGKQQEFNYVPKTTFEKMVFGEEPIKSMFTKVDEYLPKAQALMEKLGFSKDVSKGQSLALAPLFVAGLIGLDLTPFGGEKNTAKLVAESRDAGVISKLIGPMLKGKTEAEIKTAAEALVNVTKPEEVKDFLLREVSNLGKKGIPATAETIGKTAETVIPEIKSADDFYKLNSKIEKVTESKPNTYFQVDILPSELKPYSNSVVESDAYNDAVIAQVPIEKFGKPKFETAPATYPKGFRQVVDPIQAIYNIDTKKYYITDGANRFTQAIANGDTTIPAIVEIQKGNTEKGAGEIIKALTKTGGKTIKGEGIGRAVEARLPENLPAEVKTTAPESQLAKGEEGLRKLENVFKEEVPTFKQKVQEVARKAKNIPEAIRTKFISEYTPIGTFERDILKSAGETKSAASLPLQSRFELFSGAAGQAEKDIRIFDTEVIRPVEKNLEDFNYYLALKRIESRLGTGLERTKVADWTMDMVKDTMKALEAKIGPEAYRTFEAQAAKYNELLDNSLRHLVNSGYISDEGYAAIKKNNDFYAKFKVLKYINEEEKAVIKGTGKNLSMTKDQIIKAMTGIHDEEFKLADLLDTARETIYQNRIVAEKNNVMRDFVAIAQKGKDNGFMYEMGKGMDIKDLPKEAKGFEKVAYFDNGIRKEIAVNPQVANAIKGLTPTQMGLFEKIMSTAASPFRWGTTVANAGFQAANLLADIPRNLIAYKYGNNLKSWIKFPFDVIYSFFSSFKGNFGEMNDLYKAFLESGAANSTIAKELRPQAFKTGKNVASNIGGRLLDTVAQFSNSIEEGTKILGIKRGLPMVEKGKITMQQLADEVRKFSGSPDFLRGGTLTKRNLNLIYMFLGARIQGTTLDLKRLAGFTGKKEAAQMWAKLSTIVGIPALTLAVVNKEKYKSDYDKLSTAEKENYFIIFRDSYTTNDQGEMYREYWKIPKRETVKMFANIIEAGVNFAYDHDLENAKVMGGKILNDLSPVNLSGSNITERAESVVSGLNPLIKAPYEYIANRNAFFHNKLVPDYLYGVESKNLTPAQQYYVNTPKFYQWLGDQLGESPIKLQNLFTTAIGDLAKDDPITSVINRFKGTGRLDLTNEEKKDAKKILDDLYSQSADKIDSNRKAQELFNEIGDLNVEEQKKRLAELKTSGWLTQDIYDRYTKIYTRTKQDFNETDYTLQALGVTNGRRAASMYATIKDYSPEQQQAMLAEWKAKKLLSETVFTQLNWLFANPDKADKVVSTFSGS
jgi:hypothetical protein